MIRTIDIRLNAAHPELPLPEATTYQGAPSTAFLRGVPKACGQWQITAVSVAVTFPDNSTTTRAAVLSAGDVWVVTIPACATSGRTVSGLRILADGTDENGDAVTGYVLGVADLAVATFDIAPAPGETSYALRYFDNTPNPPHKGDVTKVDNVLKYYDGTAWQPFADLSDYYTAAQVDEAIDKLAAYYITADAQGNPFATHAALVNAQTYYSGGTVRVPTRNDYAVVSADETHGGEEWRYVYAVDAQGVGQWEPQYAVEGVIAYDNTVTRISSNGVKSSGIWSAIWGALTALPTGFTSLYDWCVSQLAGKVPTSRTVNGKALSADVTLTGADIAVSGTDATKIDAALTGKATKADATLTERKYTAWELDDSDASTPGPVDNKIEWNGYVWIAALQRVCGASKSDLAAYTTVTWAPGEWGSGTTSELMGTWTGDHWEPSITEYDGYPLVIFGSRDNATPAQEMIGGVAGEGSSDPNALELRINVALTWPSSGGSGTVVATRTALQGYQLGSQTDKPLASEAEAEALRTAVAGKANRASNPTSNNLAALDAKGNPVDSQIPKERVATKADLPYTFNACSVSTGTTPTVTGLITRAQNTATLGSTVTAATVTLPAATAGQMRDCWVRLTIEASSAPTLVFNDPATGTTANVVFGADSLADIDTGDNVVLFTEVGQTVSGGTVTGAEWMVSVKHEDAA